jgi:hypothetical protein
MNPAIIVDHLEQAKRHVAKGKEHVARQRNVIAKLEHNGHDTTMARDLLTQLENSLAMHVEGQLRLERELSSG